MVYWEIKRGGVGCGASTWNRGPLGSWEMGGGLGRRARMTVMTDVSLGGDGLASSRQLVEMLRLYQARGWGALPAEDLLLYLKRLEQSGYPPGREGGRMRGRIWTVGRQMGQAGKRGMCMLSTEYSFLGRTMRVRCASSCFFPSLTAPHLSFVSSFLVCFFLCF